VCRWAPPVGHVHPAAAGPDLRQEAHMKDLLIAPRPRSLPADHDEAQGALLVAKVQRPDEDPGRLGGPIYLQWISNPPAISMTLGGLVLVRTLTAPNPPPNAITAPAPMAKVSLLKGSGSRIAMTIR
jgi:hypothetical protein